MTLLSLGLLIWADPGRKKTIMGSLANDMIDMSEKDNSFCWLKELFAASPMR